MYCLNYSMTNLKFKFIFFCNIVLACSYLRVKIFKNWSFVSCKILRLLVFCFFLSPSEFFSKNVVEWYKNMQTGESFVCRYEKRVKQLSDCFQQTAYSRIPAELRGEIQVFKSAPCLSSPSPQNCTASNRAFSYVTPIHSSLFPVLFNWILSISTPSCWWL